MLPRHRRCITLRGDRLNTSASARRLLDLLDPAQVLWVSDARAPGWEGVTTPPGDARKLLGSSFDAVVLDLHHDIDPSLLGQCAGFVWGGGAILLLLPPIGQEPLQYRKRLTIFPYSESDVAPRFLRHFLSHLPTDGAIGEPLPPPSRNARATREQAALVPRLVAFLQDTKPGSFSLVAERGRGKSAALGLALRQLPADLRSATLVCAQDPVAVHEVLHFATASDAPPPAFVPASSLAYGQQSSSNIIIDEAAQIPVPVLQRIVERSPKARFIFSTTTNGYEGTGRGFTLRFLPWLRQRGGRFDEATLEQPIRWADGDPLEQRIRKCLLLDSGIKPIETEFSADDIVHEELDRDRLVETPERLEEFFGLLVHAHYRTTPQDLRILLDAPNVRLHALRVGPHLVAATMIALEGGLDNEVCEDLYWGRKRLRGHAIPETLCAHSGRTEAGNLRYVRSIRIAVHPAVRRRRLATRLVHAIHKSYSPDAFGTLFGVTPGLLRFRRTVGYELVRLGASRGSRTGEPAAVMIYPVTARAQKLLKDLRADLARDLPLQLRLMQAGHELSLAPGLAQTLVEDLPEPAPLSERQIVLSVRAYAFGSRTQESVAGALRVFVERHAYNLPRLHADARTLIEARVLDLASWQDTVTRTGVATIPAAMRGLRRAVKSLVTTSAPHLAP